MEKHKLNEYDYIEQADFDGLIPEVMNVDGVETTGVSEQTVKYFGVEAKGMDSLEVIDVEAFYED